MSGLLALLDDVAAIAKVAAASVDDVFGQAAKAGAKAAGAVIDDAAVTPKYVDGFAADRELPIVWRIARGSMFNKLVILLPLAMLLSSLVPGLIPGLLLLGGAYLCFEGAEKVWHVLGFPTPAHVVNDPAAAGAVPLTGLQLEESKIEAAVKTDFVLSAEIMTIALAALPETTLVFEAIALAIVAIGITALVYGSVAIIVRADDFGLYLAREGKLAATRATGRLIVRAMPGFMRLLTTVGTAAMLWVGGSIIVHALAELGFALPEHLIHDLSVAISAAVTAGRGVVAWLVVALVDGLLGLLFGLLLIPIGHWITNTLARRAAAPA